MPINVEFYHGSSKRCLCKTTPLTEEQLKSVFKWSDKNGDGILSKEELKEAFRDLGALIPPWRAQRALVHADKNGDGQISQEELGELLIYVRKLNYKNPCCTCSRRKS